MSTREPPAKRGLFVVPSGVYAVALVINPKVLKALKGKTGQPGLAGANGKGRRAKKGGRAKKGPAGAARPYDPSRAPTCGCRRSAASE